MASALNPRPAAANLCAPSYCLRSNNKAIELAVPCSAAAHQVIESVPASLAASGIVRAASANGVRDMHRHPMSTTSSKTLPYSGASAINPVLYAEQSRSNEQLTSAPPNVGVVAQSPATAMAAGFHQNGVAPLQLRVERVQTRSSPETRVVQAVPPFGIKEGVYSRPVYMPESQVLKHFARALECTVGHEATTCNDSFCFSHAEELILSDEGFSRASTDGTNAALVGAPLRTENAASLASSFMGPSAFSSPLECSRQNSQKYRVPSLPMNSSSVIVINNSSCQQQSVHPPNEQSRTSAVMSVVSSSHRQQRHSGVLQASQDSASAAMQVLSASRCDSDCMSDCTLSCAVGGREHANSPLSADPNLASLPMSQGELEARVTARMLNLLTDENKRLRSELELYIRKTFKLQQLELQYQKIQREYEELARRAEKREQLEMTMKFKLQEEMSRLRERNGELRNQLEMMIVQLNNQQVEDLSGGGSNNQLTQKDLVIAQLLSQHKELLAFRDRQDIELQAQHAALEEQRTHIKILDKALNNAEEKVSRLDEECKRRQALSERVEELQKALRASQELLQKREESFKLCRGLLEKEIAQLQLQKTKESNSLTKKQASNRGSQEAEEAVTRLRRELQNKDELLHVRTESARWHEFHHKKPNDRECSQEDVFSETRSHENDTFILDGESSARDAISNDAVRKKLIDLKSANQRMEARLEFLESTLAEKNALIRVLRHQSGSRAETPMEKDGTDRWTTSIASYGSLEANRARLQAVKARLVQTPTTGRYVPKHSKFSSVDSDCQRNSNFAEEPAFKPISVDAISSSPFDSGTADSLSSSGVSTVPFACQSNKDDVLPLCARRNLIDDVFFDRVSPKHLPDEEQLGVKLATETKDPTLAAVSVVLSSERSNLDVKMVDDVEQIWQV